MHAVSFFWSNKSKVNQAYQVVGNRVSLSEATSKFTYRNHKIPDGTTLIYKGPVKERKETEHLFLWRERGIEGFLHPNFNGALKAGFLIPIDKHAKRVASRYLQYLERK